MSHVPATMLRVHKEEVRFGCVGAAAGGGERNLKVWQRRKHRPSRAAVTAVACPFSQDTIIFSQAGAFGFLEHGASAAAA
jgi:hypothetical protein